MRVLVTGATGFAGSHIVSAVAAAGHEPVQFVRDATRAVDAFPHVVGDVTRLDTVQAGLAGVDAVVHAAAAVSFDHRRADEVRRTNVDGTANVLRTACERGLDPVVFLSSVNALLPTESPVLGPDDDPKRSDTLYGASKAAADEVARSLQDEGKPVVIVYPGGIYGPGDPHVGEQITGVIWMLRLGMIPSSSGGYPMVDVRDLAAAVARTLEPGRGPRRYMCGGRLLSGREMAAAMSAATSRRIVATWYPGPALVATGRLGDVMQRRLGVKLPFTAEGMRSVVVGRPFDNSRAEADLGFSPRPPEDTLRDTVTDLFERGLVTKREAGGIASAS